ncbi:MAG: FHA domain-containing protein, partial [Gammaproteobacteria bacterium]
MLTLNVISCRGLPPPEATSVSFDRTNGTIGRAVDNDLVLPDPENFISRHHAKILYEDGIYILADTSLSGTVIDDGEPLKKRSAELCDGMRIYIGDYELGVEIREGSGQGPFPEDYSESDMLTDILARPGPSTVDRTEKDPGKFPRFADSSSSGEFPREPDPYAVFDDEAPLDSDSLAPLESKSPLLDSFEPPLAGYKPAAADIPEEFDLEDLFGNRDSAGPDESPEASPRSGDTDRPP